MHTYSISSSMGKYIILNTTYQKKKKNGSKEMEVRSYTITAYCVRKSLKYIIYNCVFMFNIPRGEIIPLSTYNILLLK